jgi:hypothetical protein
MMKGMTGSCLRPERRSSRTGTYLQMFLQWAMPQFTLRLPKTTRQTFEEIEQLAWANRARCAVMKAESNEQGMED